MCKTVIICSTGLIALLFTACGPMEREEIRSLEQKMTKAELIDAVYATKGTPALTKNATAEVVDAVFEALKTSIRKDGRFSYPGFGTFNVKHRQAKGAEQHSSKSKPKKTKPDKTISFEPAPAFENLL